MKVTKGYRLISVDGGRDVIMDRDMNLEVDSNFILGDFIYRVVEITRGNVYIKSI